MKVFRTVREFRKALREALDYADRQEGEVVLRRGSKVYILKVPLNRGLYDQQG